MTFGSDTDDGVRLPLSTGLRRERTWNNHIYFDLERLLRSTLRGHGLPVRRFGGECAGFAQRRVKRRHHHVASGEVHVVKSRDNLQGD